MFIKLRLKHTLSVLLLVGLTVLLPSCDSFNCPLNSTVATVYNFYGSNGQAITIGDTLTVTAMGTDQVLVNRLVNESTMSLPMSYYAEADTLIFTLADSEGRSSRDTLWVTKQSTPHSDDPSCPMRVWHQLTAVQHTYHLIDSVAIVNRAVNYDGLENIRIFFRTE